MKHRLVLGLAVVLALSSIVVGVVTIITAHDGGNNLAGLGPPAALGAVLLILIYSRLRKTDQGHK